MQKKKIYRLKVLEQEGYEKDVNQSTNGGVGLWLPVCERVKIVMFIRPSQIPITHLFFLHPLCSAPALKIFHHTSLIKD